MCCLYMIHKKGGIMLESRRCFCRKDSQVADAILIKLLLGNNGTAFAKWARFSEMRRREACTSRAQRKGIFSLPYTETEPLAERHANTKLFLSLLFFFFLLLSQDCMQRPHHAFHLQRWLMGLQLLQHAGMLRDTHAEHAVSSSNTSTAANSQARQSHINECGSKSQSWGRAFKQQWLRVYFFFLDTHCGSNVCVSGSF